MLPIQSSQFEHAALKNYLLDHAYDEMFSGPGDLHHHCQQLLEHFISLPVDCRIRNVRKQPHLVGSCA